MRKIIIGEFMSLDGVIQAPGDSQEDTEGGFARGGWQRPYFDADAAKIMDENMAAMSALLLGRVTYQIFAAYWPFAPEDEPFAKKINNVPKYVVSTTLNKAEWSNSTLIKKNVPEEIAKLKQQSGSGTISVIGSSRLAQALMQHNLVDEYVLWIHPVVLGSGKRLFADGVSPANLKLVETRTTGSGVSVLRYLPDNE